MLSPGPCCDLRMLVFHLGKIQGTVLLHTEQPSPLSLKAKRKKQWFHTSPRGEGAGWGQGCSLAGSGDEPSVAQHSPESLHLPQPSLACFPNPTGRVSGCWSSTKAPGQRGEGIPRCQSGQDATPRTAHSVHLPFPAPKTRAKPLGKTLPAGATSGQLMAACRCPRGLCSSHKTHRRGLHAPGHWPPSPYAAVEHPELPLGHHSWVAKCRRVCFGTWCSYVRERESGGDEP